MKKLSSILFTATLALSLAACGSSGQTTETEDTSAAATQAVESTDTADTSVSGGTVNAAVSTTTSADLVYGTATLTYAEFYAGDVSSTEGYDAVTSATTSKYSIMSNMSTDFVDETENADGYHITGVANVNIAVAAEDADALAQLNDTFVISEGEAPAQYKIATVSDGEVTYSATVFNVADTVTDAEAVLETATTWGDYQINVTDGETVHLRNSREDEFDINSEIMGIILETESGLKVGMEALQSIWVQPYEVSFNVLSDNTHNTHISGYDNLDELSKLVGETVISITYIMPDETYVYEFDGIYIKPAYDAVITADAAEDYSEIILSDSNFADFENGKITIEYTVGSGRDAVSYTILETTLEDGTATYSTDISEISALEEQSGSYSVTISSDNYADIDVALPASSGQMGALEALIEIANEKLSEEADETLEEHIAEAQDLISDSENATSAEIAEMISELTQLTAESEESENGHAEHSGESH